MTYLLEDGDVMISGVGQRGVWQDCRLMRSGEEDAVTSATTAGEERAFAEVSWLQPYPDRLLDEARYRAFKLDVLRFEDGAIAEFTTFGVHVFGVFDLPSTL